MNDVSFDSGFPGRWWTPLGAGRIRCDLCPRLCNLGEGQRGFCFVRRNQGGRMILTAYGRSTGFCIDPVEKKPLNHFLPGTPVLSFGTAGCNLGCRFCQNWDISKSREVERLSEEAMPDVIARVARDESCRSVAFTYNDPVIFAEYVIDTALACRDLGIRTIAVTAGYMESAPRREFFKGIDAANVDLKAFTDSFYRKVTFGRLDTVLDTLCYLREETTVWLEITNLIIPGQNDDPAELRRMCAWIVRHLGADTPLHFSAFHPDFKMRDVSPTSPGTLREAYRIARAEGLRYVYLGNVHDPERDTTYCPRCGEALIIRDWYELKLYALQGNCCWRCGMEIPGHFEEVPGRFGRQRRPLSMAGRGGVPD